MWSIGTACIFAVDGTTWLLQGIDGVGTYEYTVRIAKIHPR